MRTKNSSFILAPTDLSNYLSCHHLTNQDLLAASGRAERPVQLEHVLSPHGIGQSPQGSVVTMAALEATLGLVDGHVVCAHVAASHQAVVVEFPVFVAVGSEPLA